jgi:hypothetical protein
MRSPCSVSVCVFPLLLLGNGSLNMFRCNEYTRSNRKIVGRVIFYAVHVVSKESRRLVLLRTSCHIYYVQYMRKQNVR